MTVCRTLLVSGLAAVLFLATVAGAQDPPEGVRARPGQPAPDFTLKDLNGNEWTLAAHRGKTVVLQWFNADCPFVVNVFRGNVVARTLRDVRAVDPDVVFVAIDSTANKPRAEVVAEDRKFLERYELESLPVLIDYEGAVGRQYDARTTPHVYVIDGKGVLRYHGEITDDPLGRKPEATNRVINAVQQIVKGETVSPEYVRPWGCSVKYKRTDGPAGPGG